MEKGFADSPTLFIIILFGIVRRTGKKTLKIIGADCLTATDIQRTRVKVGLVEIIILPIIHQINCSIRSDEPN